MKKVDSIVQYKSLMQEIRKVCKRPYSNMYYTVEQLQRYIDLERMYYHETQGGIIFLFDEGLYYKAGLYLDGEQEFDFPEVDKKLLVRDIYREGKRDQKLPFIVKRLEELGFDNQGTTAQVCAQVQKLFSMSSRVERYVKRLEQSGFRFGIGDISQIDEMEKLLYSSEIIKDYHIEYKTEEEKMQMSGNYMGVWDKDGNLCAASIVSVINGVAQGVGIAIQEKYKMSGLAPFITYYRSKWLLEQGIDLIQGWLLLCNQKSILYHTSLGYEMTDKRADEWVKNWR
ncbi:MAG: hypothetical protein IJ291_06125 [Lachnospiraceae bacterium]|nr:hypothetical protein [Lachnospiraceae bacterium]